MLNSPTRDDGAVFEGWYADSTFDESVRLTPGVSRVKSGSEIKAKWNKCYAFTLYDGIKGPYGQKNQDWYEYYVPAGTYRVEFSSVSRAQIGKVYVCSNTGYSPSDGYPVLKTYTFNSHGSKHQISLTSDQHFWVTINSVWFCQRSDVDAKYTKWVGDGMTTSEMVWIIVLFALLGIVVLYVAVSIPIGVKKARGPEAQKIIMMAKTMGPEGLGLHAIAVSIGKTDREARSIIGALCLYKKEFRTQYAFTRGTLIDRAAQSKQLERRKAEEEANSVKGIVKVKLLVATPEKDASSTIGGALLGGIVAGGAGAIVGAATGGSNQKATFIVFYEDGHRESETILIGSKRYEQLLPFLEI